MNIVRLLKNGSKLYNNFKNRITNKKKSILLFLSFQFMEVLEEGTISCNTFLKF